MQCPWQLRLLLLDPRWASTLFSPSWTLPSLGTGTSTSIRKSNTCGWPAPMQLKHDEEIVTDEKPPNHDIFSGLAPHTQSNGSPLLAWWIQNMKTMQMTAPMMPVIHVHIPSSNNQTTPAPAMPSAPTQVADNIKLLTCPKMGPDLNINQFCCIYQLDNEILSWLKSNGYHRTKTFKHITIPQLHDMEFKHGEIASLQDAVNEWATSGELGWTCFEPFVSLLCLLRSLPLFTCIVHYHLVDYTTLYPSNQHA